MASEPPNMVLDLVGEKLHRPTPAPSQFSIFGVPDVPPKLNEKAYEPELLAIGPYHHSKRHLSAFEEHKISYHQTLIERTGIRYAEYVRAMWALEERARNCYGGSISFGKNEQDVGNCLYMKRKALYGKFSQKELHHLKESFGPSNELIISLQRSNQRKTINNGTLSSTLQQEAQFLASYNYEKNTLWGKQARWKSVFCNPSRSAFLGSATSSLNDTLVQDTRWNCGLLEVTFSKCSPPLYGLSRMPLLQTMCYSYYALQPFYSLPLWCLASVPQLCLINEISLYPKVSSPWFVIFSSIFLCSLLKHLVDVLVTGGSVQTFSPTNKLSDDEQVKLHKMGKFNFQTSTKFLAPLATLVMLNMIAFSGGIARMVISGGANELLGQVILSFYILLESYPIIEGMAWRKDKGQVPASVGLLSFVLSIIFLLLGSVVLRLI
ncbi:cellulose synthase-like protein G2 [Citrus sinensis]|uniref:Cellulose synthase-like protein G2 n=1 Tax=Citrus sinensis TaxID=2711 RepID=A0ACB8I567_CITSI|nr:cellulose synthase-like protein G2 [Citrus sinensis]